MLKSIINNNFYSNTILMMGTINERIPEGLLGNAQITHFEISPEDATRAKLYNFYNGEYSGLKTGKYMKLIVDNEIMMSNTQMEQRTNMDFIIRANGKVLIAGLGIGMILEPLFVKDSVNEIIVVEKNRNVISLVTPYIKHNKLKIVEADIFNYTPENGVKFDTIYFDIWPNITADNWPEMKTLERKFRKYLNKDNPNYYMDCWRKYDIKRLAKEDRAEERLNNHCKLLRQINL